MTTAPDPLGRGYRPHLDGLRALAVYLVVAFHAGVGRAQARVTVATGGVSHTLTFPEPCSAGDWMLLSHRSPYAGHGRSYGQAHVFRPDGQLAASFVQDAMIRAMPPP